jgi:hypothetical protein
MASIHVTSAAAQCRLIKHEEASKRYIAQSCIIHVKFSVGAALFNNVRILLGTRR